MSAASLTEQTGRVGAALDKYDSVVASIVQEIRDIEALVVQLPSLAKKHEEQAQRVGRWRERLLRGTTLRDAHVAEVAGRALQLSACQAKAASVKAAAESKAREVVAMRAKLVALQSQRAKDEQVRCERRTDQMVFTHHYAP